VSSNFVFLWICDSVLARVALRFDKMPRSQASMRSSVASVEDMGDGNCHLCMAQLGMRHLKPRHFCQICGICVCATCAPHKLKLDGGKAQRACDRCVGDASRLPTMKDELTNLTVRVHEMCGTKPANQPATAEAAVEGLASVVSALKDLEIKKSATGDAIASTAQQALEAERKRGIELKAELAREKSLRNKAEHEAAQREKAAEADAKLALEQAQKTQEANARLALEQAQKAQEAAAELALERQARQEALKNQEAAAKLASEIEAKKRADALLQSQEHIVQAQPEPLLNTQEAPKPKVVAQESPELAAQKAANAALLAELEQERSVRQSLQACRPQEALEGLKAELALEKQLIVELEEKSKQQKADAKAAKISRDNELREWLKTSNATKDQGQLLEQELLIARKRCADMDSQTGCCAR